MWVVLAGRLRMLFEVIGGRREVRQLDGVVSPSVLRYVRAAQAGGAVGCGPALCCPADGVVEVATVVRSANRVRAVAARFEHAEGGW